MKTADILLKAARNLNRYTHKFRVEELTTKAELLGRISRNEAFAVYLAIANNVDVSDDYWREIDKGEEEAFKRTGLIY